MPLPVTPTPVTIRTEPTSEGDTRLSGGFLVFARVGWVLLVALTLGPVVVGFPFAVVQLQQLPGGSRECEYGSRASGGPCSGIPGLSPALPRLLPLPQWTLRPALDRLARGRVSPRAAAQHLSHPALPAALDAGVVRLPGGRRARPTLPLPLGVQSHAAAADQVGGLGCGSGLLRRVRPVPGVPARSVPGPNWLSASLAPGSALQHRARSHTLVLWPGHPALPAVGHRCAHQPGPGLWPAHGPTDPGLLQQCHAAAIPLAWAHRAGVAGPVGRGRIDLGHSRPVPAGAAAHPAEH